MDKERYELPISLNYVENWGVREAIREILQNSIDANKSGYYKKIDYDDNTEVLSITNEGTKLSVSSLVLGGSSKRDMDNQIGHEGEGYKLALVVLLRNGYDVTIINSDRKWIPLFEFSEKFNSKILTIHSEQIENTNNVSFIIKGITQDVFKDLYDYFPCMDDNYGETLKTDNGEILFDKRFAGRMFVEGLYIQEDKNFKYGYNFNSDVVDLDRDRKAINYYELRRLTAASVVTAETCCPELFKAISDSYTDVKDITDVLDDASDDFLQQYRDMLYKEKGLEENTLVATESVMRQLEQMDIDMPIVKGTEIESYLIAKANDKLGLIYQAKEAVKNKDEKEEAFDDFKGSKYARLMNWFYTNKHYLPKKAQTPFLDIMKTMIPYGFYKISDSIPEEFDYSDNSIKALKEEILKNEEEM